MAAPGSPGHGHRGHTHPWMQWAAVTTQLSSMRAPPHMCSFSSRRLTSQGQWRVTSKSSDHQGLPQTSGMMCQGDTVTTYWRMRRTETKMPPPPWNNVHKTVNSGAHPHFEDGETGRERDRVLPGGTVLIRKWQ